MTTTATYFAAIATESQAVAAVYGIGRTAAAAIVDARRGLGADADGLTAVPMSPAAYRYVKENGGAPSRHLTVSHRSGVCLREEE